MDGFQVPPADAFSPDNVGHQAGVPTRVDIPSVPKTPPTTSRTFDSRTLPGKSRNGNKSVLNSTLPPPPVMGGSSFSQSSPRASVISTVSTDSGIGTSVGGEVRRPSLHKAESRSMPNSGSGIVSRDLKMGHSADAEFRHGVKVSSALACWSCCLWFHSFLIHLTFPPSCFDSWALSLPSIRLTSLTPTLYLLSLPLPLTGM